MEDKNQNDVMQYYRQKSNKHLSKIVAPVVAALLVGSLTVGAVPFIASANQDEPVVDSRQFELIQDQDAGNSYSQTDTATASDALTSIAPDANTTSSPDVMVTDPSEGDKLDPSVETSEDVNAFETSDITSEQPIISEQPITSEPPTEKPIITDKGDALEETPKPATPSGYTPKYRDLDYPTDPNDVTITDKVTMKDKRYCMSNFFKTCEDIIFKELESGGTDWSALPIHDQATMDKFNFEWNLKYWYSLRTNMVQSEDGSLSYSFDAQYAQNYLDFYEETRVSEERFNKYIPQLVGELGITQGMPVRDALWLVCDNIYNRANYDRKDYNPNVYNLIENNLGTCMGYSKAIAYVGQYLGADALFVAGIGTAGDSHAWVRVEFSNGEALYIDGTFGDYLADNNPNAEATRNKYFLREDAHGYVPYEMFKPENYFRPNDISYPQQEVIGFIMQDGIELFGQGGAEYFGQEGIELLGQSGIELFGINNTKYAPPEDVLLEQGQ